MLTFLLTRRNGNLCWFRYGLITQKRGLWTLKSAADHRLAFASQVRPWRLVERRAFSLGAYHIHVRVVYEGHVDINRFFRQLHHHGRNRLLDGTDAISRFPFSAFQGRP
jgi:hypothetical protein